MSFEETKLELQENKGTWVKLHRDILINRIFNNEKLLKVFIWCILKATWKEYYQVVGRKTIKLLPGQFVTGRNIASTELNMPPSTSWTYLKILETNGSINIESNRKFSVISIVNWEVYQSREEKTDSDMDNKRTANGHKQEFKESLNNMCPENFSGQTPTKTKKSKRVFNQDEKEYKLAKYLSNQVAERYNKPEKNEKILQDWAVEFERMVRLDKLELNEMLQVLVFSQKDDFWKQNILSAGSFRKQYLKLLAKMQG